MLKKSAKNLKDNTLKLEGFLSTKNMMEIFFKKIRFFKRFRFSGSPFFLMFEEAT